MYRSTPNISVCEQKIRYSFSNVALLQTALTHSSCANTHIESNERLEFLGDATLGLVISNLLYNQFPQMEEGELSKIKGSIVSRKTCRKVALRLELDKFLFLGKGLTSIPDSLVANVMESVIGAIFLDGGYEEARLFVEENFQPEIDAFFKPFIGVLQPSASEQSSGATTIDVDKIVDSLDDNFKAKLQTKLHHEYPGQTPTYVLLDEKGPSHCRCFKIAVEIGARQFQAAWGNNKKETEQRAAENAFYQLQGLKPPYSDGDAV